LAESIIAHAPPRFAIAGHSMGGRIVLEVVRRSPERITGVALLDTGYEPLAAGDVGLREKNGRHALLALARTQGMRAMARAWVQGMVHPARLADSELVEAILQMMERRTPEDFAAQIRALLGRPDAANVLTDIRCPTLVLCGREDSWAPPSRHVSIARMIPGSTLSLIPECGHMSTMERPEAVSEALCSWFRRVQA
jgi:pimeloyl-ACP methyl ester carboxylesterase